MLHVTLTLLEDNECACIRVFKACRYDIVTVVPIMDESSQVMDFFTQTYGYMFTTFS